MKKTIVSFVLVICIMLSMSVATTAVTPLSLDASSQLDQYSVLLKANGNGDMSITMTVDGVTKMIEVGVDEVFIEEKNTATSSWHEFDTYYGMDDKDTFYDYDSYDYIRTIHFNGTVGKYYRVTLSVFGKNEKGTDTGWVTSITVRCK